MTNQDKASVMKALRHAKREISRDIIIAPGIYQVGETVLLEDGGTARIEVTLRYTVIGSLSAELS